MSPLLPPDPWGGPADPWTRPAWSRADITYSGRAPWETGLVLFVAFFLVVSNLALGVGTVSASGAPPVMDPIGDRAATVGGELTFTANASDADAGELVTYSLEDGTGGSVPPGATIDSSTGAFSWTPGTAGSFTFDVVATDEDTLGLPAAGAWSYQRRIDINPVTPSPNYQVNVVLTNGNFDYDNVDPSGNDLRFFAIDGTPLDYWIESWSLYGTSSIWVEVQTQGTGAVYMRYGNLAAPSTSDGPGTFLFFDDFESGLGFWVAGPGCSVSTMVDPTDATNTVLADGTAGGGAVHANAPGDTTWTDYAVRQRFRAPLADTYSHAGLIARWDDDSNLLYGGLVDPVGPGGPTSVELWNRVAGVWLDQAGTPATPLGGPWMIADIGTAWHTQELRIEGSQLSIVVDGTLIGTAAIRPDAPSDGKSGFWCQYGPEGHRDDHLVRAFDNAFESALSIGIGTEGVAGSFPANEDRETITVTVTYTISGTVFEDTAGDVLNDGAIGDADNPGAVGVDVYLYEDTDHNNALTVGVNDTLIAGPVATDASGAYSFSGLPEETYFVRVDSRTIPSAQDPATPIGDIWAVQTYGPAGGACANGSGAAAERGTPGPCYGGITGILSDGPTMPLHRARIVISGSNISNVDFGFSFNVVVNTRGGNAADDDGGNNRTVQGSLRQFIQNADAISGANAMRFVPVDPTNATDGSGNDWWSVPVTVALPTVSAAATTIDGTAYQLSDGASPRDTNTLGPEMELNGTGTAATVDGLLVTGGTSAVRDLAINRFGRNGILITTAGSNTIAGNYLGTNATGTADLGNGNDGIRILSVPGNTIGGINAGDRNVISGNNNNGLLIDGAAAAGNTIQGNYVGLNALGTAAIGNTDDGVDLSDSPGNTVGGTNPAARNVISGQGDVGLLFIGNQATGNVAVNNYIGTNAAGDGPIPNGTGVSAYNGAANNRIGGANANEANLIAHNTGDGVWIRDTAGANNSVLRNSMHSNGGLGIDAALDGVTPNGAGDPLDFPVIASATETAGTVTVDFALNVPNGNYRVEFFTNTVADGSGNGEGETFASSVDVSVTAGVPTPSSHSFAGSAGDILSATATGGTVVPFGATSEFSAAVTVNSGAFVVNSTGDSGDSSVGDGVCDTGGMVGADSECTLRAAIEESNFDVNANEIRFNIPTSDTGYSASPLSWTITPLAPYDDIVETVSIDATTQPGFAGDPIVQLVGSDPGAAGATAALTLEANNSLIEGFIVHSWLDEGLEIDGSTLKGDNNTLRNNWVGIDASEALQSIGDVGILVTVGANDNTIDGNVVGGATNSGILIRNLGSDDNIVIGNSIGVGPDGISAIPNGFHGIEVQDQAAGNLIGGFWADGNVIANNGGDGVRVVDTAGANNAVLGNSIHSNGELGIDADLDGVTDNGPGDPLNFPVITSATETAGTVAVDFDLDVPDGNYRVEFFTNTAADGSGNGEGETFASSVDVSVTAGVPTPSSHSFAGSAGDILSATATGGTAAPFGSTSEFSPTYTVTTPNGAPTAVAGGPYSIAEGDDDLALDGSGSSDPDLDALTYRWDLNNDLTYGDVTGVNPTVSWATLQSFGIDDDGGPLTIGLEVDDGNGNTDTTTAQLTVTNTPPAISVTGAGSVLAGSPYTVNLSVSDSGDDTVTQWVINWGDGQIETIAGNPATANHTYALAGYERDILASVTDEDGTWHGNRMIVPGLFGNQQLYRLEVTSGVVVDNIAAGTGLGWAIAAVVGPDDLSPDPLIYVGSYTTHDIRRYDPVTGGYRGIFVPAGSGGLNGPAGMAFGPDGQLYVSSNFSDEVLKYDAASGASLGTFVSYQSGGLDEPDDLTFGPDGNLYVTSFNTNQVLRYNGRTGAFMDVFASGVEMNQPSELVFAKHDAGPWYLYVTSVANDQVVRYNGTTGAFINVFATAGATGLNEPRGAVFGPDGNLYVGGRNQVIRYNGTSGVQIDTYLPSGSISGPSHSAFLPGHQVQVLNNPPVFGQDLPDCSDPEASWISLSSAATDPDAGDTLTYSATGLPLGLTINPSTGLITGMVNHYAAASSPYSVEITVDDGMGGTDNDTFTWTITNVAATIPYAVAGTGGANGGDDLLTNVDETSFAPLTNEVDIGTGTGTNSIEAIAVDPTNGTLYAVDGGQFGSLNVDSGVFTPIGTGLGTAANGVFGAVVLDDVRGMAFHPLNDRLYGVHRRAGGEDVMFRIDVATGAFIPGVFAGADDYLRVEAIGALDDVTDLAIDPLDWEVYAVMTDGASSELVTVKRNTGKTKSIGSVATQLTGLSFSSSGQLWGTDAGALYAVDKVDASVDAGRTLDNASNYGALAFGVNPALPPSLEGTIFEDLDGNALGVAEGPDDVNNPGVPGVSVHLYRDLNVPGAPEGPLVDTFYASTITGPTGHFFFSEIPVGPYWIVVDSTTVNPVAGGTGWAEQTYGPVGAVIDGAYTLSGVAGPVFGGMQAAIADDFNLSGLTAAEHLAYRSFAAGEVVEDIDFGFSFNVVTNLEGGDVTSPQGSLRRFVDNANSGMGPNVMRFVPVVPTNATDGAGNNWWSLAPTFDLPVLTDSGTTIDGSAFSSANGVTGVDPNGAGPDLELAGPGSGIGLEIGASASAVRDLIVNRFATGIAVLGGDGSVVAGNFLGPDATGLIGEVGNLSEGILVYGATNTVIGGTNLADRNIISGNRLRGVNVDDLTDGAPIVSNGTQILGNYIGTNATGSASLPYNNVPAYQQIGVYVLDSPGGAIGSAAAGNLISGNSWYGIYFWGANASGNDIQGNVIGLDAASTNPVPNGWESATRSAIYLSNAPGNLVGGVAAGAGNVIASNSHFGMIVDGAGAVGNSILGNQIYDNGDLGIDLNSGGVTLNDLVPGDPDSGPNDLLNFPVITAAVEIGGVVTVDFDLDVPAGDYRIEFFTNSAVDPSGYGEGQTFAGSYDVVGHAGGPATYRATATGLDGDVLTATTTEETAAPFGSTSEFAEGFTAIAGTIVVNSTGDDSDISIGDGVCYTGSNNTESDPECTLRAAIEETNALAGADTVWFDIPTSDLGYTASPLAFTLNPAAPYDPISGPLTLDARTQAGWVGDPIIQLNGTLAAGATAGLVIEGNDNTIAGFIIHSFEDEGLEIDGSPGPGDNNTLQNNWVGLDASGTVLGNTDHGILLTEAADGNLIGGTGPFDGNVIAGSGNRGISIRINSVGNTVIGNSIYGNTQLGIDLDEDGVTENDLVPGDPDSGSNDLLNFPVITSAIETGGTLDVDFDLDVPAGDYRIEFFINAAAHPTGNGEGETFAGSFDVIAHPGTGQVSYSTSFAGSAGDILIATTTEEVGAPFGSTSEFSDAFTVNRPPVLDPVGDRSVDELVLLSFTATASDPDLGDNLLFSLSGEPAGASIDPNSGAFTWTPTEAQGPGSYTFSVVVTDDGTPNLADSESITVTVNEVNVAPVLAAIGNQTVDEQTLLTFTASATDADVPANGLLFSLSGEPAGASIDPNSGAFTWTPTEAQGPGSYTFSVVVTDNGTPNLADSEAITVTVNEVNVPPVLAAIGNQTVDEQALLSFTASATDADLPANSLLFSLSGEPAGALIDPVSGVFTWTPAESQGPGSYTFDVNVVDGAGGSDSESITVTVNEVNVAPVLTALGNQTVDEQTLLTFTASATDADVPANGLLFSLSGEPAGASIDPNSGAFTWTPTEAQGPGSYTFSVVVTDNGTPNLADSESITVTVNEVNVAPVLAAIGNQTIDEQTLLSFTASATDADLPANSLLFSLSGAPAGASIDPNSGAFTWTPTEAQGPGSYTFSVVVTDNGTPNLADSESITVTVNEVNVAPVVTNPGDQTDAEGSVVNLPISASDADLPANGFGYGAVGLPPGLSIDPVSGLISGTVAFGCNAGSPHAVTVTVTDNGTPNLAGTAVFDWYCPNTNQPPVLDPVGDQSVDEPVLLSFTATASDPDLGDNLLYSLLGEPAGALIDPNSGAFTWTPTETHGPGSYTFSVVVTDDGIPVLNDSESITVTVNEVNVAPVLAAIGNQTVDEQTLLTFTASATDADLPANSLLFSLVGEPAGASIDPNSGAFTWTPTETQGPGSYTFSVVVTDDGTPNLSDSESITVTVNEVNVVPVLAAIGNQTVDEQTLLTFTASATDADVPANGLLFSLSGEPAGALIDPNSGVFTWTPTEAQGPGSYTFDVNVVDGVGGSDSETITVTVNEVDVAPVLNPIGPQGGGEGSPVTFNASAVDPDNPTTLNFTLVDGPVDAVPAGASIGLLSGVFSWTPSETQGPGVYEFYIRVTDNTALFDQELVTFTITEVNVPPFLAGIGNQTVDELALLTFTSSATDADAPTNGLLFSLSGEPAGASIDPNSGVFTWTPTEAQGPNSYTFDVVVTDDGTPNLADVESITVTVGEINVAPVLAGIGNQTVDEQTLLAFTASATDSDLPANGLLFSLVGEPAGASIDPNSGVFTWTPTEAQGPGSYTFDVVVTDDGTPNLADSDSITVTINEINVAPVLAGIGNQTVDEQTLLTFTATATDSDLPANGLLFSLVGEPAGASIDPNSGAFTWTPTETQGPGSYTFSVVVTDNGTPNLNDSESITVTVNEVNVPPVLAAIGNQTVDEQTLLTFTASATDADLPANSLLFSLSGQPAGALIDPVSGVFTWTPAESQGPGSYTFAVNVVDGAGGSDSETVTVTVNEVNVAPVLNPIGNQTVDEQTLLTFTATATDSDLPANGLTFSLAGEPAGASIDPVSGVFTWTPSETQGPGVFTLDVTVADGGAPAGNDSETITITVNETNVAPVVANPGDQTSTENDPISLAVVATDADVPANTLTWSATGLPGGLAIGPLTGTISGTVSYDAAAGSPHVVTVTATDNGIPNLANSVVFVWNVIDLNRPPIALDDAGSVAEDLIVTIDVLGNDSDPDLDALIVSGVTQGIRGSVTNNGTDVTYMPDLNWNGTDTFTYTATDGRGGFNTATVTVVVTPVNDNPVAGDDAAMVLEDVASIVNVLTNDTDIDGDPLTVISVTQGGNGSVTTNGTTVSYLPDLNWNGTDTFTYDVADGNGGFDTAVVSITVVPVNDAPVAVNDAIALNEDVSGSVSVLTNDFDVDGDPLSLAGHTNPANGTLTHVGGGVFVYRPDPNFNGVDTFTYTAGDGTLTAGATVTLTVASINDAPVAAPDSYAMVGDTVLDTSAAGLAGVLANDSDVEGDPLSAVLDGGAGQGTLILTPTGSFVYTPNPGWFGTDTFTYHVFDGAAGSAPVTVQIVVDRPNQAPVAANDQYSVGEGDTLVVGAPGVLGNDSDPDTDLLTAALVTPPTRGTVTLAANGSFIYTHTAENAADDSFTYVATDSRGATSVAVVIIRVIENLAPVVVADLISIDEDTVGSVDALANDLDPEGVALTIVGIEQPPNGVVTLEADGTLSFAPVPNWFGTTRFAYLAGDGRKSSRALVTVFVAAVNDLPIGGSDSYRFTRYGPAVLDVLANDTDVDGDELSVVSINGVEHALAEVADGALVYNAHAEWLGTETFTYTLSDGHGGEAEVVVSVTMADEALDAANTLAGEVGAPDVPFDSPEASADAPSISLGSPKGVSLLAGAFFDSFEALKLPLGFLLIALLWALIFGGLFSSPWFLFGGRRRFWSIVLVDRESMVPVHAAPDFESATVYNYPPITQNITSTGAPKRKGNTVWMPVDTPNGEGWIDAYYLTQEIDDQTFANDKRPAELAAKFVAALTAGNHRALAKLVSARGLAAVRFGSPVVVPLNRLKELLSTDKEPGWWRADALTAMEALFPERLAEPFLSSYWAGSHPEKPGKVATLLVPAEVRNFHRFTYSNAEGTWWLLFEYRKNKLFIAGIALAE